MTQQETELLKRPDAAGVKSKILQALESKHMSVQIQMLSSMRWTVRKFRKDFEAKLRPEVQVPVMNKVHG